MGGTQYGKGKETGTTKEAGEDEDPRWRQRIVRGGLVTLSDPPRVRHTKQPAGDSPRGMYCLACLKREMLAFCLWAVTLDILERFQAGWKLALITSFKKLERLKAFFRFCVTRGWIDVDPASGLLPPKVPAKPTLPFSRAEMGRMFAALSVYRDKCGRIGQENAKRLLALVLVLRYSGLRIGDAVSLSIDQIQGTTLPEYSQDRTACVLSTPSASPVRSKFHCSRE